MNYSIIKSVSIRKGGKGKYCKLPDNSLSQSDSLLQYPLQKEDNVIFTFTYLSKHLILTETKLLIRNVK